MASQKACEHCHFLKSDCICEGWCDYCTKPENLCSCGTDKDPLGNVPATHALWQREMEDLLGSRDRVGPDYRTETSLGKVELYCKECLELKMENHKC